MKTKINQVHRNGGIKEGNYQALNETQTPVPCKSKEPTLDATEQCLRIAVASHNRCVLLVRLPKALKVGCNFHLRLGRLAETFATGRCWLAQIPLVVPDAVHRNYILLWDRDSIGQFIRGLVTALERFGFLNQTQLFIADAEDGVLRQVVGCGASRQKGGA